MEKFTTLFSLFMAVGATQSIQAQTPLPYTQAFDNPQAFATFTAVDGNNDGTTWAYDDWNYQAACNREASKGANDWFVSPMFHLTKGTQYQLTFSAKTIQDGTTENFLVKLGTSASDTTTFSKILISDGKANNSYYATQDTATFTVDADGDYYIGFHYLTARQTYSSGLAIDDITLTGSQAQTKANPTTVNGITFSYDHSSGLTTLKWKAPTTFADGSAITTPLAYTVRRTGTTSNLVENYSGTTFREQVTLRDMPANSVKYGQALLRYAITATTDGRTSAAALSPFKVIGTPDVLPYSESFADGTLSHFWGESHSGTGRWGEMGVNKTFAQDEDGGLFNFTAAKPDETSLGFSGLISLKGAANPVLSFWYMYMTGSNGSLDTLAVQVAANGGEFATVKELEVNNTESMRQWNHVELPLAAYAGSNFIQVAFLMKSHTGTTCVYIDNLSIFNQSANDLAISTVSLPGRLRTDERRMAVVKVDNIGTQPVSAGSYQVVMLANGQEMGQANGVDLANGASTQITIPVTPSVALTGDSLDCHAELRFTADENLSNNATTAQRVAVASPSYPVPGTLTAQQGDGTVVLNWQQPAAPRPASVKVTDSFETAPDFTISNWGDWTLYDGSGLSVYGLSSADFPNTGLPQAFTVFNQIAANASSSWAAHTGNKEVVSFSVMGGTTDHWLISPTLSGEEQQISFYGRAYSGSFPESFEFGYSTTSVAPTDFKSLASVKLTNDNAWKAYTYTVPAGTRYFAVRVTSYDAFAMLFDDFTFVPDSTGKQDITLSGYNVYRDGVKITATPVTTTTLTDAGTTGSHVYHVTAVYDKGESVLSNVAMVGVTDNVLKVTTAAEANDEIYDLQGRRVNRPMAPGIYIKNGRKYVAK